MPSAALNAITINGRSIPIDGLPAQTTLLDFLRSTGFTGAKEGCAEGECGACMVVMVTERGSGSMYRAVNSCLLLTPGAVGREFLTVEALARDGELAEVQAAMAVGGGSQCGYCTPGFVMSLFAEQYRPDREGPCDPHALSGNLCRCTGYRPIRDAALSMGPAPQGAFLGRLSQPAPALGSVRHETASSLFERPGSLAECLALLAADPEAKLISGATDLAVEANLRFRRWPHLIGLEAIDELREFHDTPERVEIGAALPLSDLAEKWTGAPDAVRQWIDRFASLPIRNRATLGGNLATASPIGDSAPLFTALNASLILSSEAGDRTIQLSDLYTGYRQTQLRGGELIRAVCVPKPFPSFLRFYKATKRRMDDISIVSAGLSLNVDAGGRVSSAAFVFGGVGPITQRVLAAEQSALGRLWNREAVLRIQQELELALRPIDDHRGSGAYRLAIAKSFLEKFYWEWSGAPE